MIYFLNDKEIIEGDTYEEILRKLTANDWKLPLSIMQFKLNVLTRMGYSRHLKYFNHKCFFKMLVNKGLLVQGHRVFVYGTLKQGYGNYGRLGGKKIKEKDFEINGFWMYTNGSFPMIVHSHESNKIYGESYIVTSESLKDVDRLEGHPNWYKREIVTDTFDRDGWVYVMPEKILGRSGHQIKILPDGVFGGYTYE